MAVWFDPDWTPGAQFADDGGTERMTELQSRPITGQTQYTVSQGTLAAAPATLESPNGRRVLNFAGAQYLLGAAALAAQFAGSAPYSSVSIAARSASAASRFRFTFGHNTADALPDRATHWVAGGGTDRESAQRVQSGGATNNSTGLVLVNDTAYVLSSVYTGAAYSTWADGAASLVAAANTQAPATLDELIYGAVRNSGAIVGFWLGMQAGLILVAGALSTPHRQALETAMGIYYGYPI
jgi:hypothetical protein